LKIFLSEINLHGCQRFSEVFRGENGKIVSTYYTKMLARKISEASGTRGDI
jgi:hypothetical protein